LTLAFTKYTEAANYYTIASNLYKEADENALASTATNKASDATALASAFAATAKARGLVLSNVSANMDRTGMTPITFTNDDDGYAYLPFTGMDFYFFGINYGDSVNMIYMNTNYAFGFGPGIGNFTWPVNRPAILFDNADNWNFKSFVSPPQDGTKQGLKYVRILSAGTLYNMRSDTTIKKEFEIYFVRGAIYQYMLFNCVVRSTTNTPRNDITDGSTFQNTFGTFTIPQAGNSYVITSDLNGNNWQFSPNTHLIL
jgi:hypothetical protein